jgi:protein ImuB
MIAEPHTHAKEATAPLYVCVHVPEFPAQARLRLRPELAETPVVIVAGDPPFEEVCSANAHAFRMGVAQGMTRAELDSFQGLNVLRRSEQEERAARAALLEAAGAFTPRVEVQPSALSAFVMVLDMAGTTRLFGQAQQAVQRIVCALRALQLFVQVAASANLHAAVCVAPSAQRAPVILPVEKEGEHLRALPLAALTLTAQQSETLALWGLRTLGELAALPEEELVVRLGQEGKRLRLLARGQHPHLMVPEEPVFLLEEFIAFDAPVDMLDSLLFVLGPMLDQLLARAQNRAFALASVTVKLGLDGGGEHERTVKPALPVFERSVLLKLLHLDMQAHPPSAGVVSVFVHAEPGDRSKVQLGLFSPQLPEPLRLDVTLARIEALVGEERVGRAKLGDTHRPDSFTMESFCVPGTSATAAEKREHARHAVALRRCRPPLSVTVRKEGARPAAFFLQGKRYTVQEAYGPWRRSGDWWSAEVWSCEEWDVCAVARTNGSDDTLLCVVSHDLLRHHWQIDALYD